MLVKHLPSSTGNLAFSAYRMKNVEEALTSWKLEIRAKRLDASNGQEHGQRRAECEKVLHFEVELRVFDQELTSPCQSVFAIVDRLGLTGLGLVFSGDHGRVELSDFLHLESLQIGVDALLDFFAFSFEHVAVERLDEDATGSEWYSEFDKVIFGQKGLFNSNDEMT